MKNTFLVIFLAIFIHSKAQIGQDYSINLPIENFIAEQANNQGLAYNPQQIVILETQALSIELLDASSPFIAFHLKKVTKSEEIKTFYQYFNGKSWSEWLPMTIDPHTFSFQQEYLPIEVTQIKFKWVAHLSDIGNLSEQINYRLFFPGKSSTASHIQHESFQAKDIDCSCPIPAYQDRLDWCPSGNCPVDATPTATTVSHLVVHHSAGSNTSPDWAATVRSIWDYHTGSNGWDDIGYNYLIDPNGIIYEGRGNDVSGAHFSCMNPGTMGVCLLGDFTNVAPSAAMIQSLTRLLAWKACEIDKDPRDTSYFTTGAVDLINVCGHRDGNNVPASCTVTSCPGNNVYAIMNTIRNNIYNYSLTCSFNNPSYSNIVILNMLASESPIYVNEDLDLEVQFKNIGDAAVSENINIDYRINGTSIGSNSFQNLAINQTDAKSLAYTFLNEGTYQFCAFIDGASNELNTSNNSFCVNLSAIERPDTSTSISNKENFDILIFPNPANNQFQILSDENWESFTIINLLGQDILHFSQTLVDVSSLTPGMYYLQCNMPSENKQTRLTFLKE